MCALVGVAEGSNEGTRRQRAESRAHHGDLEAESVGAEAVRGGERAVVQVQDDGAAAADAQLHLLRAHREARRPARHHERRHALRTTHNTQRIRLASGSSLAHATAGQAPANSAPALAPEIHVLWDIEQPKQRVHCRWSKLDGRSACTRTCIHSTDRER